MINLKSYIKEIPNWPKRGVSFKDFTPLLNDPVAFRKAINQISKPYLKSKIGLVVGIDARGFILASAIAYKLKAGLAIIRKEGKLPRKTIKEEYSLEYASNIIEMHKDSIKPKQRVLIVDDVLATRGTMQAAIKSVKKLKGDIVGIAFLIILDYLKGEEKIKKYNIHSLIKFNK